MTSPSDAHLEDLKALRALYLRDLPDKMRCVEQAAAAAAERWEPAVLDALYHQSHRLAGSAGIYGFEAVSRAASRLEAFVSAAMAGNSAPDSESRTKLGSLVSALGLAADDLKTHPSGRRSRPR